MQKNKKKEKVLEKSPDPYGSYLGEDNWESQNWNQ